jgi:hypothetical protein
MGPEIVQNWKYKSVQRDQQRDADDKYSDWNREMKIREYGFGCGSESTVLIVGFRQETISSGSRASVSVSFFRIAAQIIAQVSSHTVNRRGEEYTVSILIQEKVCVDGTSLLLVESQPERLLCRVWREVQRRVGNSSSCASITLLHPKSNRLSRNFCRTLLFQLSTVRARVPSACSGWVPRTIQISSSKLIARICTFCFHTHQQNR